MKCSLDISNFLKEISSLSYSIAFLYFFALIAEEGFLISPRYSLELCIQIMGFFRQEYWSGLPIPSPGYLPNPGIELGSPVLQADSLSSEPQ